MRDSERIGAFFLALCASFLPQDAVASTCRLTPEKCRIVIKEQYDHAIEEAVDCERARCWNWFPAKKQVIDRSYLRLKGRLRVLPKDIGNELSRLLLCDSEARLRSMGIPLQRKPTDCR